MLLPFCGNNLVYKNATAGYTRVSSLVCLWQEGKMTTMKNTKVKAITDTAVAAALCVLFIVIVTYVPFLSLPVSFAVGIPLMCIAVKWNWKFSIMACLCAAILSVFIIGNILSVALITLTYALPGLVFGICASRKTKFSFSIAFSAFTVLLGLIIELMLINGSGDGIANMINSITENMSETMKSAIAQSKALPLDDAQAFVSETMSRVADLFMLSLPTIIITASVIYAYIISMIGIYFMKRLRVASIPYTKFHMIAAPRSMCIITFVLLLIIQLGGIDGIYSAALQNLYNLSILFISLCGLSAIDYSLKSKVSSGIIRAIIYIAFFAVFMFSAFTMTVLTVIGFMDGLGGRRSPGKA